VKSPASHLNLIVAIDGPSGVGKSTVARLVAASLNLPYLDTGKLYRAVGWACHKRDIDLENEPAVSKTVPTLTITAEKGQLYVNGEDASPFLADEAAGRRASLVSRYSAVRSHLVHLQQVWGREAGGVMEGRDIGSRVFPETPFKFYLHARSEIRIWRRYKQIGGSLSGVAADLLARDERDRTRSLDPLQLLPDHIPIDTSHINAEGTAGIIARLVGMKRDRTSVTL